MPDPPDTDPPDPRDPSDPPAPRRPVRIPKHIPYRAPRDDAPLPGVTVGVQALLGFLTWVAACAGTGFFVVANSQSGPISRNAAYLIVGLALGLVIFLCIYFRAALGWTGFIPGVLLGLCLGCLLPVGLVAVICGRGPGF